MNPDDLKAAWQTAGGRLTVNADLFLKEVRRNERAFSRTVLWRDVQEIGVGLLMVPVWFYLGAKFSLPWAWYLGVPALLWVVGFLLVDRWRQKRRRTAPDATLGECLVGSLAEVEHQIWLLRNVLWWYLLPPGVAITAFFVQVGWRVRPSGWFAGLLCIGLVAVEALIFVGIYWLNQKCVRTQLEPRRQELRALLKNLREANPAAPAPTATDKPAPPAKPGKRNSLWWLGLLVMLTAGLSALAYLQGKPKPTSSKAGSWPASGDTAVTNLVVPIREKHHVPAIAVALVTSKGLQLVGVAGTRKQGTETAVTLNDQWHLGSDTKAMTATLVAKLVEQGRLKWDTTVAEVFPDLTAGFHPEARTITVQQLLSHRSGLPANPDLIRYGGADGRQERLRVVQSALSQPPAHPPGTEYLYSNLGYSIVGAIAEKITGKTWEAALREEVFTPLGMTSVGFGGPGTPGLLDQPWGHTAYGHPVVWNGPTVDNPPVLGPAGRVHCTIQDWGKFITDQLRGARGEKALLRPETYQKLHTPAFGGEYALGWIVVKRDWGGGTVLNHAGDNTMNFANVWVAPKRDFAILVCLNQSGDTAFQASDEAVGALIRFWEKKSAPRMDTNKHESPQRHKDTEADDNSR